MNWRKVARRTTPRCIGGSDYGKQGRLLLDAGQGRILFWTPGHATWVHIGPYEYRGGWLWVEAPKNRENGMLIFYGGRLSKARLNAEEVRLKIAKAFSLPVSELPELDPKVTWELVVEDVITEKDFDNLDAGTSLPVEED